MAVIGTSIEFQGSCSNRQKEWFQEAMLRSVFPFDSANLILSVKGVTEPPCEGHNDYMCTETHYPSGMKTWSLVYLRNGTEDPSNPHNAAIPTVEGRKRFWLESAIHEIGHAFTFAHMAINDDRIAQICNWFQYRDTSSGIRLGTPADWDAGAPTGENREPWKNSITEALAEWIKDLYMPAAYREFSQRTNWDFRREMMGEFFEMVETIFCEPPVIDT